MQSPNVFNLKSVLNSFKSINNSIQCHSEVPFDDFIRILNQFCLVFKELNSFLGIAFADVKQKCTILSGNRERFPGHLGLISFIRMEIAVMIHMFNSKNGREVKGVPKQFSTYSSTARNVLRMMWLLTFIRVTFERLQANPNESLSGVFSAAYEAAFGKNHGWLLQKSAKVAMLTSPDRLRFYQVVLGHKVNEEQGRKQIEKSLPFILPVHEFLWKFYEDNNLTDLK